MAISLFVLSANFTFNSFFTPCKVRSTSISPNVPWNYLSVLSLDFGLVSFFRLLLFYDSCGLSDLSLFLLFVALLELSGHLREIYKCSLAQFAHFGGIVFGFVYKCIAWRSTLHTLATVVTVTLYVPVHLAPVEYCD